ncbi:MAG: bifunctional phosphoglucose/phosphomannose isomerase [Bacteroidia bacterium]|nr:bifunctional phosphoglucose/phosphomannose isomerase [Bacteroidia bacterium]MDW8159549.1 bifunctional phosphoglucose/phosphomannose isomerase [Bacteroidia bacterium]
MEQLIANFDQQIIQALEIAKSLPPSYPIQPFQNIATLGVGGSGFVAEVFKDLTRTYSLFPIFPIRSYDLPWWVQQNTLCIVISYSGNTEETIAAMQEALKRKASIIVFSSGGNLQKLATEYQLPHILLPSGYPPRAAYGFSLVLLLSIAPKLGILKESDNLIQSLLVSAQQFNKQSLAQEVAQKLHNRIPIVYCADINESLAIRLHQQINENSKQLCWHNVLPEMNHNEIVGWENPYFLFEKVIVVLIRSQFENPRVKLRFEILQEILNSKNVETITLNCQQNNFAAEMMELLLLIDWISFYLAQANQTDPTPVPIIDFLKNKLAQVN